MGKTGVMPRWDFAAAVKADAASTPKEPTHSTEEAPGLPPTQQDFYSEIGAELPAQTAPFNAPKVPLSTHLAQPRETTFEERRPEDKLGVIDRWQFAASVKADTSSKTQFAA